MKIDTHCMYNTTSSTSRTIVRYCSPYQWLFVFVCVSSEALAHLHIDDLLQPEETDSLPGKSQPAMIKGNLSIMTSKIRRIKLYGGANHTQ